MPFLTFCVRSVCAFMRVCFLDAYESERIYIHACSKKFFEGIMLVENEPPCGESWLRACWVEQAVLINSGGHVAPAVKLFLRRIGELCVKYADNQNIISEIVEEIGL